MIDSEEIAPMNGDEESDNEEERDYEPRSAREEPMEHDGEEGDFMQGILESLLNRFPVLQTREGRAGLVHNFLRGLQLLTAPVPSGESKSFKCKSGQYLDYRCESPIWKLKPIDFQG